MAQIPSNADQRSTTSLGDMDEVKKVFDKFDTNGDGKISVSELRSVFKALGVDRTSSEEIKEAVSEIDKDGDGAIDLREFVDFHRINGAPDGSGRGSGKEINDAFEMYDRDKNGLISAQELHEVMQGLGQKCSVNDCAKMIGSVDVDGDSCVNFEEFKKMMRP
jgi:calcium-binding protein CML